MSGDGIEFHGESYEEGASHFDGAHDDLSDAQSEHGGLAGKTADQLDGWVPGLGSGLREVDTALGKGLSAAEGNTRDIGAKLRDSRDLMNQADSDSTKLSQDLHAKLGQDGADGSGGGGSLSGAGSGARGTGFGSSEPEGEPEQARGASGAEKAAGTPKAEGSRGEAVTTGDPVDVATGEVLFTQTDVALPGELPLVLSRSHRSAHRTGRWLGESWISSFDQRLRISGDKIIGVFDGGRVLTWPKEPATMMGRLNHPDGPFPESGPRWRLEQDGNGWTVKDPRSGTSWRFEPRPGFFRTAVGGELPLVAIRDRAGHAVRFEYGESGEPLAAVHSGGYRVETTVEDGRVTELALADPDGGDPLPLVGYTYGEDRQLSGVVNSSGLPLAFTYDGDGRLASWTDRAGNPYTYTYGEDGRCVRGESPSGLQNATFEYEPGRTRHTDAEGAVTVYEIDDQYRVTAVTDPLGAVTRTAYGERGEITEQTDPLARVTRFEHDEAGNLTRVMLPDGTASLAEYDDRSLPVAVTGPDGAVWRQSFDERGNRVEAVAPDGSVTRWGYDQHGHVASVTRPDGTVTEVVCDAAGLPTAVTGPDGRTARRERDSAGRVVRETGPDGTATETTWSLDGLPLSRTLPDGAVETWEWTPDELLARHVSPSGAATSYEYGPFDVRTAVVTAAGTRTEFSYDRECRLASVTHAGLTWDYELDAAGRTISESDFNGAVTRYEHDLAGQRTRQVNAVGQEIRYEYGADGSLASLATDGQVTAFAYDGAGNLSQARSPDADVTFTRNVFGQVTEETVNGRTLHSEYDGAGRVTRRVTPSGAATDWSYSLAGLPEAVTASGRELRFGFDLAGQETARYLPGGAILSQEWDPSGRMTGQTVTGPGRAVDPGMWAPLGEMLQRRSYSYSPDGFLTRSEDRLNGNRAFTLDHSGRVTGVAGDGWVERYSYDALDNITSAAWPEMPGDWLDETGQGPREVTGTRVTRAGNIRYRFDAAGRVVARTRRRISRKPETWQYTWDAENRLTGVRLPDGTAWRYRHDAFGRRVAKQHLGSDGQVLEETRFSWNGSILAEQTELTPDGERHTTWDYEPGTFTPLAQHTSTRLRDATQEEIDRRFHSIVTDLAGAPSELIAEDGTLAGRRQATLWGGSAWAAGGASTPLRFPGQYEDPETGLYQNGQRYYDPVTGSYLSPDPLGIAPGPNPHRYVSNPHVLIDPSGLEPGRAGNAASTDGQYGPFYRRGYPKAIGLPQQVRESGELRGQAPQNNLGGVGAARVKSYRGVMPPNSLKGSFEFYTPVAPRPEGKGAPPGEAVWFEGDPGVSSLEIGGVDWASIPVTMTDSVE